MSRKAELSIGLIAPFWLPKFGGGERYEYRMAKALEARGHRVHIFTGTMSRPDRNNGDLKTTRYHEFGEYDYGLMVTDERVWRNRINHYHFLEAALKWVQQNRFDQIILGNTLTNQGAESARELVVSVKTMGIPIGIIYHDLMPPIQKLLGEIYVQPGNDWVKAKAAVLTAFEILKTKYSDLGVLSEIGSPCFFRPDFIITNSHWTNTFINPFKTTNSFVLHPIISDTKEDLNKAPLEPRDILFINPQQNKNPELMEKLIKSESNLTFRVLRGSWGDSLKTFVPRIEQSDAYRAGRVHLLPYVDSIASAYQAAKILIFPSFCEGYGMSAVEPMRFALPVIASNYPAVAEAVGDAAPMLCPYKATTEEWMQKIKDVLTNHSYWSRLALLRAKALIQKNEEEIGALSDFLLKYRAPRAGLS